MRNPRAVLISVALLAALAGPPLSSATETDSASAAEPARPEVLRVDSVRALLHEAGPGDPTWLAYADAGAGQDFVILLYPTRAWLESASDPDGVAEVRLDPSPHAGSDDPSGLVLVVSTENGDDRAWAPGHRVELGTQAFTFDLKPLAGNRWLLEPRQAPTTPASDEAATVCPTSRSCGRTARLTANAQGSMPLRPPPWLLEATFTLAVVLLAAWILGAPRAAGLSVPLFSRFTRDQLLDHDRRSRLHECIRQNPGITFGELQRRIGLESGAAQHHLRLLEQSGLVGCHRDGRATRYYLRGERLPESAKLSRPRERILRLLAAHGALSAPELAARLGHRVQSIWHHLRRLSARGVVAGQRDGRRILWRLATA